MIEYQTHSGVVRKLGRLKPLARPQTLHLTNYVDTSTVTPPSAVDYYTRAKDGIARVYLNDRLGCCVVSGLAHSLACWSAAKTGTPLQATDQEIANAYFGFTGGRDSGCVISQVLDYEVQTGSIFGGDLHKLDGYVSVDWTNKTLFQVALDVFGPQKLGIDLPADWANSSDNGIWDLTNSRIVGGHDVEACGYNEQGVIIATWGGLRTITWRAFLSSHYIDEAYTMLSPDWYGADGVTASGVNVAQLKADLDLIKNGQIPPLSPLPTPAPVIPPPTYSQAAQAIITAINSTRFGVLNFNNGLVNQVEQVALNALQSLYGGK